MLLFLRSEELTVFRFFEKRFSAIELVSLIFIIGYPLFPWNILKKFISQVTILLILVICLLEDSLVS